MDLTVRRRASGRCHVGPREPVRRDVRRRRLGVHNAGGYPQPPVTIVTSRPARDGDGGAPNLVADPAPRQV